MHGGPVPPIPHHAETWGIIVVFVIVGITAVIVLTAIGLWIKYLIGNRN
jgi:hypothetical protein